MEKEQGYYYPVVECDLYENKERNMKFYTYQGYDNKGKKFTLKFTRDAYGAPETKGIFELKVKKENLSKDGGSRYTTYWCRGVEEVAVYVPERKVEEDLPL